MKFQRWAFSGRLVFDGSHDLRSVDQHLEALSSFGSEFETGEWVTGEELTVFFNDHRKYMGLPKALSNLATEIDLSTPSIQYLETVSEDTSFDHILNRHDGDEHRFARVKIEVTKRRYIGLLNEDYVPEIPAVSSSVVGGAIPKPLIACAIQGLEEALRNGPTVGGRIVDLDINLVDGAVHDKSSDCEAFLEAAKTSVHLAMASAGVEVLEPVLKFSVTTPKYYAGEVIQAFEGRRGAVVATRETRDEDKLEYFLTCSPTRIDGLTEELAARTKNSSTYVATLHGYELVEDIKKLQRSLHDRHDISSDGAQFKEKNEEKTVFSAIPVSYSSELKRGSIKALNFLGELSKSVYFEIFPSSIRPRKKMLPDDLDQKLNAHGVWLATDGDQGTRLVLRSIDLRGWNVPNRKLDKADIVNCDLRGARFAGVQIDKDDGTNEEVASASSLKFVDFSYSRLERAVFSTRREHDHVAAQSANATGARFVGCTGTFGAEGAYFGQGLVFDPATPPVLQRWMAGSSMGDFPSWNLISTFQNLRLLAVSNTLAIVLVFYAAIASLLNSNLASMKASLGDASSSEIAGLVNSLPPLPTPSHFGYLLVVVVFLTITNILYNYLCPQSIGSQLTISSYSAYGSEVFQSIAARYNGLVGRWFCFLALGACCSYIVYYLIQRVVEALAVYLPSWQF